jgi:hypothetical protein
MPKFEEIGELGGVENKVIPEYSFEEGVAKVFERITEILNKQPYAVVACNASGVNVGKTEFSKKLMSKLLEEKGISSRVFYGAKEVAELKKIPERTALIFEQMAWGETETDDFGDNRKYYNGVVARALEKISCHIKGVDLWVGIYRPDVPFAPDKKRVLADIVIRNEGASDETKLGTNI